MLGKSKVNLLNHRSQVCGQFKNEVMCCICICCPCKLMERSINNNPLKYLTSLKLIRLVWHP